MIEAKYYFLFGLALIWIIFATVQDLRKREVANWLNFSLIAFGLAYRAFYSAYFSDWMFFAYGLMGFVLFFGFANLFYYSRVFAGGDAKLLMGLGAILPYESFSDLLFVGVGFILLLFVAGAVYSLIYSIFLVWKNYSKFSREFGRRIRDLRGWMISLVFALLFVAFVYFVFGANWVLFFVTILFALFAYVLIICARALDVCMVKLVSPGKLTEGDWLVGDVKLAAGKVVRKTVHGLSARDIAMLKRAGKKVLIKDGIPFTPAFLVAFLVMVFFSAALGFQVLNLFYSLF